MNIIVGIPVLVLLCGCWAAFQLWIGHQADGTPVDSDDRACTGCGRPIEPPDETGTTSTGSEAR